MLCLAAKKFREIKEFIMISVAIGPYRPCKKSSTK